MSKPATSPGAIEVVEDHTPFLECDEAIFAQVAKDAIHMYGAQAQCIGKVILGQRAVKSIKVAHAHQPQPGTEFEQ